MLLKRLKANPGTNNQSFSGKQTHVDTAREDMMRAEGRRKRKRRRKLFRGELGKRYKKYEPNSGRDPKGETQTKSACQISTNDDNQTASRSPKNGEAIGGSGGSRGGVQGTWMLASFKRDD